MYKMNVHHSDKVTAAAVRSDARSVQLPVGAPRQTKSARANERRRALLEATLDVIGREGIDAVSHRRVAEVANVPLGSTTYYFASRDDLLVQALEYFAQCEIAALHTSLGGVSQADWADGGVDGVIEALLAFLAPQVDVLRWRTVAQYTLFQEAARRPELQAVVHDWNEAWWKTLAELMAALGHDGDVRLEARMLLAMLDGLLLTAIAVPDDDAVAVLRAALERWMHSA